MTKPRQPQSLSFLGWFAKKGEITVLARLTVQMADGSFQMTGPVLLMQIPHQFLLQDDICVEALNAQAELEKREARAQRELEARAQPGLF